MKIRNKLGRICCAMLAVIMLVTSIGMPDRTYAAKNNHPYYIKINRRQNCVTVYEMDKKGKYSLDERDPYRVLFEPKPPVPKKADGGIDMDNVKAVVVTDLHIDTHE